MTVVEPNIDFHSGLLIGPNVSEEMLERARQRVVERGAQVARSVAYVIPRFAPELVSDAQEALKKDATREFVPIDNYEAVAILLERRTTVEIVKHPGAIAFAVNEVVMKSPDLVLSSGSELEYEQIAEAIRQVLANPENWPDVDIFPHGPNFPTQDRQGFHVDNNGLGSNQLASIISPQVSTWVKVGDVILDHTDEFYESALSYVGDVVTDDGVNATREVQPEAGSLIMFHEATGVHDSPEITVEHVEGNDGMRTLFHPTWNFTDFVKSVNKVLDNPRQGVALSDQIESQIATDRTAAIQASQPAPAPSFGDLDF